MKTLTPEEALIALAEGKKVTSSYLNNNKYGHSYVVLQGASLMYNDDSTCTMLHQILDKENLRIYEEFVYPMWFENKISGDILKFTALTKGYWVADGKVPYYQLKPHTDTAIWKQVDKPQEYVTMWVWAYLVHYKFKKTEHFYTEEDAKPDWIKLEYTETKFPIKD
jgi:hypothetical protein